MFCHSGCFSLSMRLWKYCWKANNSYQAKKKHLDTNTCRLCGCSRAHAGTYTKHARAPKLACKVSTLTHVPTLNTWHYLNPFCVSALLTLSNRLQSLIFFNNVLYIFFRKNSIWERVSTITNLKDTLIDFAIIITCSQLQS